MKILVTGATGYIGKRLIPLLLNDGHVVVCAVRDKTRAQNYFKDRKMWKVDRLKRISSKSEIIIIIKDLSIEFTIEEVEKAVAIFTQEYTSDNYSDKVIKKITLVKNNNNWLIESEKLLDGKY